MYFHNCYLHLKYISPEMDSHFIFPWAVWSKYNYSLRAWSYKILSATALIQQSTSAQDIALKQIILDYNLEPFHPFLVDSAQVLPMVFISVKLNQSGNHCIPGNRFSIYCYKQKVTLYRRSNLDLRYQSQEILEDISHVQIYMITFYCFHHTDLWVLLLCNLSFLLFLLCHYLLFFILPQFSFHTGQ